MKYFQKTKIQYRIKLSQIVLKKKEWRDSCKLLDSQCHKKCPEKRVKGFRYVTWWPVSQNVMENGVKGFRHVTWWRVSQKCSGKKGGWIQGWGLLKLRSLISPLRKILILQKYMWDTFNDVHICQVSPQHSCGDTCQIWTWYHSGNHCFHHSEKLGK